MSAWKADRVGYGSGKRDVLRERGQTEKGMSSVVNF